MSFHKLWIDDRYVGEFADRTDAIEIAGMLAGLDLKYYIESFDGNHRMIERISNRVPDELVAR